MGSSTQSARPMHGVMLRTLVSSSSCWQEGSLAIDETEHLSGVLGGDDREQVPRSADRDVEDFRQPRRRGGFETGDDDGLPFRALEPVGGLAYDRTFVTLVPPNQACGRDRWIEKRVAQVSSGCD